MGFKTTILIFHAWSGGSTFKDICRSFANLEDDHESTQPLCLSPMSSNIMYGSEKHPLSSYTPPRVLSLHDLKPTSIK